MIRKTFKITSHLLDIENLGFKKVALIHSNRDSSNGGLIGWIKEDNLNKNIKKLLSNYYRVNFHNQLEHLLDLLS